MKKICGIVISIIICLSLFFACPVLAEIEKNEYIDVAFTMLDAGNIFLERYNELTDSDIEAWFEYGLPYFFGGTSENLVFLKYPKMYKQMNDTKTTWYKPDTLYVYGFDCMGYARWICSKTNREKPDSIGHTILMYRDYKDYYVFSSNSHLDMKAPDWSEITPYLQIGDLYMLKHGGYHVAMYIGTLRDYGFTAEEVPELTKYLDYPLVIHCGVSPAYAPRYEELFASDYEYYKNCELTDGGVQVSILGVPMEDIPCHLDFQKQHTDYFLIGENEQIMTVIRTDDVTSYCWYRPKAKPVK